MKKIFALIIIIVVGYGISVFLAPNFADKIADLFGIKSINTQIRSIGNNISEAQKQIPDSDEIQKKLNSTIDSVKDGIEKTKLTIDEVRSTLSGAENTYNKAKDTINETIQTVDKLKQNFNEVQKTVEKVKNTINTGAIK